MILTLIASGPILGCLCVAPIKSAPVTVPSNGYAPVQIQIEQIRPYAGHSEDDDLQANMQNHDTPSPAPIAKEEIKDEITITTPRTGLEGSIPAAGFRGGKAIGQRLDSRATGKPLIPSDTPPAQATMADKATPQVDSESDTKPIIQSPDPKSEIDGLYVASTTPANTIAERLHTEFPSIKIAVKSKQARLKHKILSSQTVLVHGPPDQVSQALELAEKVTKNPVRSTANRDGPRLPLSAAHSDVDRQELLNYSDGA